MKMISFITKIIKKTLNSEFSDKYTAKLVFELNNQINLLVISKKGYAGYNLPLEKGLHFKTSARKRVEFFKKNGELEELEKCSNFRISEDGKIAIYRRKNSKENNFVIAKSRSGLTWREVSNQPAYSHSAFPIQALIKNKKKYIAFISAPSGLKIAEVEDNRMILHDKVVCALNNSEVIGVKNFKEGIFISTYEINKHGDDWQIILRGTLVDSKNPWHVIWKSEEILSEEFVSGRLIKPEMLGTTYYSDDISSWVMLGDGNVLKMTFLYPFSKNKKHEIPKGNKLKRSDANPIISPQKNSHWESVATFNPGAFIKDGRVHFLYRAIGKDDNSVLGYVSSDDGINIIEKHPEPAYIPGNTKTKGKLPLPHLLPKSFYSSGGGLNGGCEDPRLTLIDDKVYIIYTAFDSWSSIRIGLTSLPIEDFLNKNWNWKKPVYLSPPGQIHKNWVIFPEKINGKYAIIHGIFPKILIEYVDSLDAFDGSKYIMSEIPQGGPQGGRKGFWDNKMRGAGAPPIKTPFGWILLYHAMDMRDPNRYKLGAMVLDLKDPTRVIYRSNEPILAPDAVYENEGLKAGVVYCCAAIVKDDTLYIYYGGADTVTCVATIELDSFINKILKDKPWKGITNIIKIK